jgi:hypothetical protein
MSSIFIQIASYHDFELGKTIAHAEKQKSGKHDIYFGVFNCYYKNNEIHIPSLKNVRIIEKMAPDGIGVGRARNIANSLYDGEDYYLQVDSHTRFKKDWDDYLVSEVKNYQDCGIEKPLLSTYPGTYRYDDNLNEIIDWGDGINIVYFGDTPQEFTERLIPGQRAVPPEGVVVQKSISAGSIFTVGEFGKLDFNDKIAFWGEEIFIAAKAWTNGFDLLVPPKQQIFHLYYEHDSRMQKNNRRHVWNDFQSEFAELDKISKAEIEDIFKNGRIGKDSLGDVRTLEEFGLYAGLDFKNRRLL